MEIRAFIKNHIKEDKKTQILTICVETDGKKEYKNYFVNFSDNKKSVYLQEAK